MITPKRIIDLQVSINGLSLYKTGQKMKFFIKDFFSKCDQIPQKIADLVTCTGEIINRKLHFLCSASQRVLQQLKSLL